jgi:hypothetical protein
MVENPRGQSCRATDADDYNGDDSGGGNFPYYKKLFKGYAALKYACILYN